MAEELRAETRISLATDLVARAWKRIILTTEIPQGALMKLMRDTQAVGFLRGAPDLDRLVESP